MTDDTRFCAHPPCGAKLRSDSKMIWCTDHKRAISREPVRTCSHDGCTKRLRPINDTGFCRDHHKATNRVAARACDYCGTRLRSDNKQPFCKAHKTGEGRGIALVCGVPECDKPLMIINKVGYCRPHSGVHHRAARDLLERRHAFEIVNRWDVWVRDGGICHLCGDTADVDDWHADHVIPLARGGADSYQNLAVSHVRCNTSKQARNVPSARGFRGAYALVPASCGPLH